ncbi:MAG: Gfo/Idh/MocA family oxidoreductase, partial [Bacteroidia bacterium]|nr:Gfo/Idh/MocA family oxidoreductase [Bacteroidia bacterium]
MLNFAFIGCGRIAHRHADLLGNNKISNAQLGAVCDIIPSRAEEIGKKYNIPWYIDIGEMMAQEDIDVVSILTPSGMHAEHTTRIAKYKKHIIVEKPMSLTLKDADNMIQQCNINGVKLFVIKQNRFNVPVIKLREALLAGRFGKLVLGTVRVRWCRTQEYYNQDKWRGTWKYDRGVLT